MQLNNNDKAIADKYRKYQTRIAMIRLYEIYDRFNGTTVATDKNCWCSESKKQILHDQFYAWFENKLQEEENENKLQDGDNKE